MSVRACSSRCARTARRNPCATPRRAAGRSPRRRASRPCTRSRSCIGRPASAEAMVGLVIVSHSAQIAEGVAELAREMGGSDLAIEPAGGLDDGSIGTDAQRVPAAIERVASDDGVLVLMDLGSALMSAEIAVEMLEGAAPVELSAAPLVEGAVAAAARARGGGSLAEVAAEARGALRMKDVGPSEEPEPIGRGANESALR